MASIQANLNLPNEQDVHQNEITTNNGKMKELFKKIYEHMQQIRYNYQRQSYKNNINNEWLLIASIFDRIFFLIYTFIILFSSFAILRTK